MQPWADSFQWYVEPFNWCINYVVHENDLSSLAFSRATHTGHVTVDGITSSCNISVGSIVPHSFHLRCPLPLPALLSSILLSFLGLTHHLRSSSFSDLLDASLNRPLFSVAIEESLRGIIPCSDLLRQSSMTKGLAFENSSHVLMFMDSAAV